MDDEKDEKKPSSAPINPPRPNNQSSDGQLKPLFQGMIERLDKLGESSKAIEKAIKENNPAQESDTKKTNKTLDDIKEEIKTQTKNDQTSVEDEVEGKKLAGKSLAALLALKESFAGLKKGIMSMSAGTMDKDFPKVFAVWAFFKNLAKIIGIAAGGFVLANMSVKDFEKIWNSIKDLFKKIKEFLEPIVEEFKIWLDKTAIPQTVKLLTEQLDNLGNLFENLKQDFEGWTKADKWGKFMMFTDALESLGGFMLKFGAGLIDYFAALLGYEGSITKDIRQFFDNIFGPTFTAGFMSVAGTLVGAMTVLNILGMPRMTFIRMVGKMLWVPISRLLGAVYTSLNPVALTALLIGITAYYHKEIFSAFDKTLMTVANWFDNIMVMVNNALVDTKFGKLLGLQKKEFQTVDEKEAAIEKMQREKLAEAEAEVKRLEAWRTKSKARPGEFKKGELFDDTEGVLGFGRSKDMMALDQARIDVKKWSSFKGNWKEKGIMKPADATITLEKKMPGDIDTSAVDKMLGRAGEVNTSIMDKIQTAEGWSPTSYPDAGGFSIGYGFHLSKKGAADILKKAGISASVQDLIDGKKSITKAQAEALMKAELPYFEEKAKNWLGKTEWDKLSDGQRMALTDMSYNMGGRFTNAGKWPGLKEGIISGSSTKIAAEMVNTPYFQQTGKRAQENMAMLMTPKPQAPNQTGEGLGEAQKNLMMASFGEGGGGQSVNIVNQDMSQNTGGDNYQLSNNARKPERKLQPA